MQKAGVKAIQCSAECIKTEIEGKCPCLSLLSLIKDEIILSLFSTMEWNALLNALFFMEGQKRWLGKKSKS